MFNNRSIWFLISGLLVVFLLIYWLISLTPQNLVDDDPYSPDIQAIACPSDARLCPDGTVLERVGPDCKFPPCPEINLDDLDLAAELADCLPKSDLASRQFCEALLLKIQDFDTCVLAGFPVREIYPEECATPDGRLFSNQ